MQANYNERIKWLDSIKKELYKLKIDFVSVGQPQDDSFYLDGAHKSKGQELMMNGVHNYRVKIMINTRTTNLSNLVVSCRNFELDFAQSLDRRTISQVAVSLILHGPSYLL